MNATTETKNRWAWVPSLMPGVTALMREARAKHGNAHVDQCWKKGVIELQPGWFFAVEGALAIGTPDNDQRLAWFASLRQGSQPLLDLRRPDQASG